MKRLNRRLMLKSSAVAMSTTLLPRLSRAQTSAFTPAASSPDDLKGTLPPFGAIRAGNADSSIPAWTGENLPLPAGFESGTTPQYFTDEKPLYSVTGANMAQYQDKLAVGAQALLQK